MPDLVTLPREHFDLLYQASLEFNSTLDPDQLLPRLFDRVLELLDAEAGSIWLRRNGTLVCEIARGPASEGVEGLELPLGAGIVGDVALKGEPELVADARNDPRFIHQVDEATGFVTRSMLAAPLTAKGEVVGVFQLLNRRSGTGRFDAGDQALLHGLAQTAGLALRNAQLHAVEKRAADLRALLQISREISASLDTDRIVLSVVNLGTQALAYDRAAIALEEGGRLTLRAISGEASGGRLSAEERELEQLIAWLAARDEVVYLPDIQAEGDEAELASALRAEFGDYLARTSIRSLCLAPLRDEQGRLGALYMEAGTTDFLAEGQVEQAELLANQVSVALRNAQLYDQVPLVGVLGRIGALRRRVATTPREKLLRRLAVGAGVVLLLVVLPWGERIEPRTSELVAVERTPVRATVAGVIVGVTAREGELVEPGRVLATLRDDEARIGLGEAEAARAGSEREAAAGLARGDVTAARIASLRAAEASERQRVFEERLGRTSLRAPVRGVVLTSRPHERLGSRLGAGETFVVLGRTDRLEVESRVAERDVERVHPGQTIRLRVPAHPNLTFVGTVRTVASQADSTVAEEEPTFVVRSVLENRDGLLRPGMTARAKIVGGLRPIGLFLVRPFWRWAQLRFWR